MGQSSGLTLKDVVRHLFGRDTFSEMVALPLQIRYRSDAVSSLGTTFWALSRTRMKKTKPLRAATRTHLRRDFTYSSGRGAIVAMSGEAISGPLGSARSSDPRAMEFMEVTTDMENLESVSTIPQKSIGQSTNVIFLTFLR